MRKEVLLFLVLLLAAMPLYASHSKQIERITNSTDVLKEILNIPEDTIPKSLLEKAECVVIVPSMKKAAMGIGGNYGRGVLLCRVNTTWSDPVMVSMTGGSLGFQLGGTSTDIVLLIMNRKGVDKLLQSKVTLGADASAAAGPKGRTAVAATDAQMRAEILCYARSRGLFAGVSLAGSVLKPSSEDDEDLYAKVVDPKVLLKQEAAASSPAAPLIQLLSKYPAPIDPEK